MDLMPKGQRATQIAFYAPLKSPLHPTPSGDRKIARLFISALQQAGFEVDLASSLRSFDKHGEPLRQRRMVALAQREARRILRRWQRIGFHPRVWFSYHLYYKAADLIGPIICKILDIPYVLAEASWAKKRAEGPWALYHSHVDQALQLAAKVICINPIDRLALEKFYLDRAQSPIVGLAAFIADAADVTKEPRHSIAKRYQLEPQLPWLITIAMMRQGDKFSSYQRLSQVIQQLRQPCQLLIVGDGVEREQVNALFAKLPNVRYAEVLSSSQIQQLLPHCSILVWPAINEALGMVFLEAQQAAVAVVAGDQGGVSSIIKNRHSGLLLPAENSQMMAEAIDDLLLDEPRLSQMQRAAKHYVATEHSISSAAKTLCIILNQAQASWQTHR